MEFVSDFMLEEEDPIFVYIRPESIEALRKLNAILFPVSYNELFYQNLVDTPDRMLSLQVYIKGRCVGAICCRREVLPDRPGFYRLL